MAETSDPKVIALRSVFADDDSLVVRISDQLAHLAKIQHPQRSLAPLTPAQVARGLNTAFWASLGFEEGRPTRVRLAFVEPDLVEGAIQFQEGVQFEIRRITKLAPAVVPGGSLGVSAATGKIWGMLPNGLGPWLNVLTIALSAPGVLQVDVGPLKPFAVVSNGEATLISGASLARELQRRLRKRLPQDDIQETQAIWRECLLLADLVRAVLEQGHGGTLLFVPDAQGAWSDDVAFAHRFAKANTIIRDTIRGEIGAEESRNAAWIRLQEASIPDELKNQATVATLGYQRAHEPALRQVAAYAAVDGAVVITRELAVLGFGAKITTPASAATEVFLAGPEPGKQPIKRESIGNAGGTRHQSAARFVAQNKETTAIVVSHDRHVSMMFWGEQLGGVVMIRNAHWWR
jgi:hypothetical protein